MASFVHDGQRIAYTVRGDGPRAIVLIHGLLLSQKMHIPLAKALARRGNRVITIDLLGHGDSDRPRDMWRYSMAQGAEQVVALLDHLELQEAVIGGTSLGANVSLETAALAPERVRGMVIEMAVLDNAIPAVIVAFSPALFATTFGEPVMRRVARLIRAIPRGRLPLYADVALDLLGQEPGPSGAVLQGLAFGRFAPHRSVRRTFEMPALVIGHRRDPVHPFSDSGQLSDELPDGRLIQANSLFELRFKPERLTAEIGDFLDDCWKPRKATARSKRAAS